MHIWFLSAYDQPKGKSARTYEFCVELVKLGHTVTMFTNSYCHWSHEELLSSGEKFRIENVDGLEIVWLKTYAYKGNGIGRGLNMLANMLRIYQASKEITTKPDIILGPSVPIGTGWVGAFLAKKLGCKFVYEVRDVWPDALVSDGSMSKYSVTYLLFKMIERHLYKASDAISATMPYLHQHVEENSGDSEKVVWIPNGIDLNRFSGCDVYDGGDQNHITAMYIGGFGAAHDVVTIVRAAKILQDRGIDSIRFVIIGNGPKKPECIEKSEEWGLRNIEFRDPVPKSEIPNLQMSADILLACVLDSEAYKFGLNLNKLFDYFASGRPVIFSGNAPNDPVKEQEAGFSIQPECPEDMADALVTYLKMDPRSRVRMGLNGQKYASSEYDMTKLGKRMEMMFKSVCSSPVITN